MANRAALEHRETPANGARGGLARDAIFSLWHRVRRARRDGGLSLRDLPTGPRVLAGLALGVIAVITGVLAVNVLTGWWPAPVVRVPGQLSPTGEIGRVSVALFLLTLVAIGAAMSAMANGAASSSGWRRRSVLLVLAGFGVVVGRSIVNVADLAGTVFPDAAAIPRLAGLLAIASAVVLAVLPSRIPSQATIAAGLAAVPAVSAFVSALILSQHSGSVPIEAADPKWPDRIEGLGLAAGVLSGILVIVSGVVATLFVWKSVVAARASRRRLGALIAGRVDRTQAWLGVLIGGKIAWVIAGYSGVLPSVFAQSADTWARARTQDPLGVLTAVAIALVIGWWLLRGARPAISDDGVRGATAFLVVGFFAASMAGGLLLLVLGLINETPATYAATVPAEPGLTDCVGSLGSGASAAVLCLARAFTGLIEASGVVTYAAAWIVVAVLAIRRRNRPLVLAFVVLLAWMTPTAIGFVVSWIRGTEVVSIGRPQLLTLDVAITAAILVLWILWVTGRQRSAGPGALALVLASSTLIANAGSFVPPGGAGIVIAAIIVGGAVWEYLFDSGELNESGPNRAGAVASSLGLRLVELVIVLLAIAFDEFTAGGADLAELFVPPVVLLLVGAELSHHHRVSVAVSRRPTIPSAAASAVAGALAVLAIAVVASRVVPSAATAGSATHLTAYGSFVSHVDATRTALRMDLAVAGRGGTDGDAALQAFLDGVPAEVSWVASAPTQACFADEAARWRSSVDALATLRAAIVDGVDLSGPFAAYVTSDKALDVGRSPCQTHTP